MAQLVVRNLDEGLRRRLQERAVRHGRSMEEEVRDILQSAASIDEAPSSGGLGSRIARRFDGIGLTELTELTELRDAVAQAARLDE